MTSIGIVDRYQATAAQLETYVAGLPLWVNVWRGWMFFIFTAAVVFVIWKREARWLSLTMIVSLFAYNVVSMLGGVGRFPSIVFVALWSPLALYFARRRPQLVVASRFDRVYAWWATIALATLVVSLAFDIYNVVYSVIMQVP
jgi:hypothetical protein